MQEVVQRRTQLPRDDVHGGTSAALHKDVLERPCESGGTYDVQGCTSAVRGHDSRDGGGSAKQDARAEEARNGHPFRLIAPGVLPPAMYLHPCRQKKGLREQALFGAEKE
jgi:hypothetical protein